MIVQSAFGQTPSLGPETGAPIPMDQLGSFAGRHYRGDGLSVTVTPAGAQLSCVFQRLQGQATARGLWLHSIAETAGNEPFRALATEIGRATLKRLQLPSAGTVQVADNIVRFVRDALTEEYSVSVDGVRQDFVVAHRPDGDGELQLRLQVAGAEVKSSAGGAELTLPSGRRIAYGRLQVTDASGRKLPARIEATSATNLLVTVNDREATYPIRIDPTFSDANWMSMNPGIPGANSVVYATAVDGSGNLYIGGEFSFVGDVSATRVAKWNGTRWSALGGGLDRGNSGIIQLPSVFSLTTVGNDLYAAGDFMSANNSGGAVAVNRVAKWDGNNWSTLGSGFNNSAYTLTASGTDIYVSGSFTIATNAGGVAVPVGRIAKWNGTGWSGLGEGLSGSALVLLSSAGILYAGGDLIRATNTGGAAVTVNRIARWDGTNWSALGQGLSSSVGALTVSGNDLFAGGGFTFATNSGGATVPANRIARWNGSSWSALGLGVDNTVSALAMFGSDLHVGGSFKTATNAGGAAVMVNQIAKWNGASWSALGSGVEGDQRVTALTVISGSIYAGGFFQIIDGVAVNRIARWNGSTWTALGAGMDERVGAMAVAGTNVYVGGSFVDVLNGGTLLRVNHIARWNGTSWSALGSGMNDSVSALAVSGTNLFAAGPFTTAGGVTVNRIAKWDGTNWSALGLGVNSSPNDLEVSGTNLYVGGGFQWVTNTGGTTVIASRIARWNGSSWSAVGGGVGGTYIGPRVNTMVTAGNDVYVGGLFGFATNSGGAAVRVNSIARWNGSSWSALGLGSESVVAALLVSGSDLYMGGDFNAVTNTGGGAVVAQRIAKWNGSTWSPLGGGFNSDAFDLLMLHGELYAGGSFTRATNSGGASVTVNCIAKWDGTNWSALGSGLSAQANALGASGSNLYVGGNFMIAGGKVSPYLTRLYLGILPGRFDHPSHSPGSGFAATFLDGSIGQTYRIQSRTSLISGSWTDFTNVTYNGPAVITAPAGPNRFFRAVTP